MGTQISWLLPAALVAIGALGLADLAPPAHRRAARQRDRLGRLAARHRHRAQLRQRHHPPVLHGGSGPGDRRARRHRRRSSCGARARPRSRAGLLAAIVAAGRGGRSSCSAARDWHPGLRWVVLLAGVAAVASWSLVPAASAAVGSCAPLIALTLLAGADGVRGADRVDRAHRRAARPPARDRAASAAAAVAGGGGPAAGRRRRQRAAGTAAAPRPGGHAGGTAGRRPGGTGRPARPAAAAAAAAAGGLGGATTVSIGAEDGARGRTRRTTSGSRRRRATTRRRRWNSRTGERGDVARRLQRHRPGDHPGRVREARGGRQDPLLRGRPAGLHRLDRGAHSTAYEIQQWVATTFTAKTVGGTTVYDLTGS